MAGPIYSTQRNLNGGIITSLLDARADLDKFRSSLREAKNFLLTPYGPARRRMGYKFIVETKFSGAKKCRLISFQASTSEGFCIEMGDYYARFIFQGEQVMDGSDPYEIETPWSEDQLFSIQWDTVNDIAFMVMGDVEPQLLRHFDTDDWEVSPMPYDWPPFQDENITTTTLQVSGVTDVPIVTTIPFVVTAPGTDPETVSNVLSANGSWEVVINSLAVDPALSPSPFVRLRRSVDGGTTWTTVQSFTTVGTFTGSTTGLLRLEAKFYVVDSTLETSVNSPEISVGDIITVNASSSVFTAQSVGRYYSIGHLRDTTETRIGLNAGSILSDPISVLGRWDFSTFGAWFGHLYVDRSKDNGATWEQILQRTSYGTRGVIYDQEEDTRVLLRIRFTDQSGSGGDNSSYALITVTETIVEGVFKVTAYTSPTEVTAEVLIPFLSQTATTIWRKGAWSTESGYPRTVQWHQNRIAYGGTREQVGAVWFSKIEDYYYFREGTDDDDAFTKTLGGTQQEAIQWMCSRDTLAIGTTGGEWAGFTEELKNVVTPTGFAFRLQTGYGGEAVQALVASNVVLFVQKTGRKVREFGSPDGGLTFDGADLTQLAIDITIGGIRDTAIQRQRDTTFWATTFSGQSIPLLYERNQQVVGWTRFDTLGEFESVCSVYESGDEDSIYALVKRTISGEPVRYIERLTPNQYALMEAGILSNMPYMDSFYAYDGTTDEPGFTSLNLFLEDFLPLTVSENPSLCNAFDCITEISNDLDWDLSGATTKAIILITDTGNSNPGADTAPVVAALAAKDIVLSQGPNFGSDYNAIVNGEQYALSDMLDANIIQSLIVAQFEPNDKLQLCFVIDKLSLPDLGEYQLAVQTLQAVMESMDTTLHESFDQIDYCLVTMNSLGYEVETDRAASQITTIPLPHLIGETVQIVADGITLEEQVVPEDGEVTIEAATKVFAGLGYESLLETMPMSIQLQDGDSLGRTARISEVNMKVLRSVSAEVAPVQSSTAWEPLSASNRNGMSNDAPIEMGDIGNIEDWRFVMPPGYSKEPTVVVRQTDPKPLNILAIQAVYEIN